MLPSARLSHDLGALAPVGDDEPRGLARARLRHVVPEAVHRFRPVGQHIEVLGGGGGLDGVNGDDIAVGQADAAGTRGIA